ncbi:putative mitochondrial protein [Vitis vinifera]|uniref:Putative mitochondrial protein n=1 Tax=Vitis vinifera TaxID=29760 RepID=A0A438IJE3_VITVI|nr:putative mitochondrial protein [Vitis vinifera]
MLRILRKGGNIDCSLSRVVKDKRPLNLYKAQMQANLAIFRGSSVFNQGVLSPGHPLARAFVPKSLPVSFVSTVHYFQCQPFYSIRLESNFASQVVPFLNSPGVEFSSRVGVPFSEGVAFPLESSNRNFKDCPILRESLSSPEELCVSGRVLSPEPEPPTLLLEGFQIEGLTPTKMVKVQSVLESLRIRIVRDNGKDLKLEYKRIRFQEEKEDCQKKHEVGKASRGIVIMWDSNKFKCTEKVLGSFSVTVKLNSGGDFNVIRKISKKLGDSKLTFNMRCFHEFIRKSGLLDPPLRNVAFTWSNMFENMQLLHPEFKEKFSDWWQECTVEGRIDLIEQEGNLNLDLVSKRTLRRREVEDLLLKEEVHWRQKSRVKWIKEGDCNSKFFHRMANGRGSRKFIKSLISERGVTLSNIEDISEEIVNSLGNSIPNPKVPLGRLKVYQECWDVIKEDLMRVFLKFHTNGIINQSTSATFIALVLSGRLRKVLHETISGSQGAFVEGRHILDAVLIANEVVDEKKRSREEGVVFKIDLRSFAILVNGNAKGWVKASRGLRQGDPLSPFLFTLVADVLSRLLIKAEETGLTKGFFVGRDRTRVSLLQFADDTIFFSKASLEHLQNLKIILLVLGKYQD